MERTIEPLLKNLRLGMETLYRERLRGVYLYGSYARGEEESDSDLDVLIVLDRVDSYGAEIARTSELVSRVSLEYGISVSRVFVSEREWQEAEGPFLANAREESVPA